MSRLAPTTKWPWFMTYSSLLHKAVRQLSQLLFCLKPCCESDSGLSFSVVLSRNHSHMRSSPFKRKLTSDIGRHDLGEVMSVLPGFAKNISDASCHAAGVLPSSTLALYMSVILLMDSGPSFCRISGIILSGPAAYLAPKRLIACLTLPNVTNEPLGSHWLTTGSLAAEAAGGG